MKKGTKPARVARQTPGITGQIENSQVMAFYTEAASSGRVLIDREDYVPTWIDDADRCEEAALLRARATEIVTKPGLGRCMVESCRRARVPYTLVLLMFRREDHHLFALSTAQQAMLPIDLDYPQITLAAP
ncbi:hypothetical protein [Streptomyces syringium]|uniref:hypothetical protein n=1 Tax=Streptomyces syringium TaxID=76729 RepID=UPI003F513841